MNLDGSWPYIQKVAGSRLAHNKTRHHVYDYGEGIEVLGVAGEIVARRFLGLSEMVHDRFDHGVDIFYCGMKIDVKTTILTPKIEFRFLQWPITKPVKAEIVLLTAVDPLSKRGTVIGYALRHEVQLGPINYERRSPCHEIPVRNLHPGWELLQVSVAEI